MFVEWTCPNCGKTVVCDRSIDATDPFLDSFVLCCSEKCRKEFWLKKFNELKEKEAKP
jgi:hypothetical protein